MDKEGAEKAARMTMSDLECLGNKFTVGAFEQITKAFEYELDADRIARLVDLCVIPNGIEMPWGMKVVP